MLDYQWHRNQLINAVCEFWPEYADEMLDDPVLQHAEHLSYRLSEIVAKERFDEMRVNLMLAREVAYWREWLNTRVANADKNDESELVKIHEMSALISSFAEYRF